MSATVWCSGKSLSTFPGISIRVVVYCVSVKSLDRLTLEECVWFLPKVSLSPIICLLSPHPFAIEFLENVSEFATQFFWWVVVFLLVVGYCGLCVEI